MVILIRQCEASRKYRSAIFHMFSTCFGQKIIFKDTKASNNLYFCEHLFKMNPMVPYIGPILAEKWPKNETKTELTSSAFRSKLSVPYESRGCMRVAVAGKRRMRTRHFRCYGDLNDVIGSWPIRSLENVVEGGVLVQLILLPVLTLVDIKIQRMHCSALSRFKVLLFRKYGFSMN